MVAVALALVFLPSMVWGAEEKHLASIISGPRSDSVYGGTIPSQADTGLPAADPEISSPDGMVLQFARGKACPAENSLPLSLVELPRNEQLQFVIPPASRHDLLGSVKALASTNTKDVDLLSLARKKMLPEFAMTYRALAKRVTMFGLARIEEPASRARTTIVGSISTYNPYRDGREEGGPQTASGEPYDPAAWTAAIKTELRGYFGGVRFGRLYQPTFALVQSGAKQLIVKINDVGPLRPGRVLDLNERSMRHFDPFLRQGLIEGAKVTLLPGEDWTPGPVGTAYAIDLVTDGPRPLFADFTASDATASLDSEMARWRSPLGHSSYSKLRDNGRGEPGRAKAAKL